MRRAVFVDRDGTLIEDKGYLADPGGVELLPRAGDALAALSRHGFLIVLITNQSGIGRGYFDRGAVDEQHQRLARLLDRYGVTLAGIEVCPHAPWEGCSCRKPAEGMLHRAAAALDLDLPASFMIGDKESDVLAGKRAGCAAIRLGGTEESVADLVADDLMEAARWIVARTQPQHRSNTSE